MIVTRIVPNVSSEAFDASRDFDAKLFDLEVSVELDDWYLQLKSASDPKVNIGLVQPGHELLAGDAAPSGTYGVVVTIQVDDVDEACRRAKRSGAQILAGCRNKSTANDTSSSSTRTDYDSTS